MKRTQAMVLLISLMACAPAQGQVTKDRSERGAGEAEVIRNGSRPAVTNPPEHSTGNVRVDASFRRAAPARVAGGMVSFEPGARTAWHSHPLGQTLIVTSGVGWTQCGNGLIVEMRPGDIVWCPPGVRHWHGASPTTGMTHIAIYEMLDGKAVDWAEKVSDAEYLRGPKGR